MTPVEKLNDRLMALKKVCRHGEGVQAISHLEHFRRNKPAAWRQAKMHALHTAVIYVRPEMTRALIAYGVEVDAPDEDGRTALLKACGKSNGSAMMESICLQLIDSGASLTGRYAGSSNQTLLHGAIISGLLAVPKRLVEKGLNVDVVCDGQSTPLHYAAGKADPRFALLLVHLGAEVNAMNRLNQSPLYIASQNPVCQATVLALIAAGARPGDLVKKFDTGHAIHVSPLAASVRLCEAGLIQKNLDGDLEPQTLDARLREACLQSEAMGRPEGAHLARSLYAARLSKQWVKEINANSGLHP